MLIQPCKVIQEQYVHAKAAKFRLWFNKHNERLRARPTLFVNVRERERERETNDLVYIILLISKS